LPRPGSASFDARKVPQSRADEGRLTDDIIELADK
jgi:hypothetical protein